MVISGEVKLPGLLGTISMMFDLANEIKREKGITVSFIDFGGGIGIPYRPEQDPVDLEGLGEGAKKLFEEKMAGFEDTRISFECGRMVTGPYGFLVPTSCVRGCMVPTTTSRSSAKQMHRRTTSMT